MPNQEAMMLHFGKDSEAVERIIVSKSESTISQRCW